MSMSSFDSLETDKKQNVNIDLIDGVFVPLKDEETVKPGVAKIGNIENEEGFEFKDVVQINQYTDHNTMNELNVKHLIFDDTPVTRIFIGGVSIFGLYVLFNLLYKKI